MSDPRFVPGRASTSDEETEMIERDVAERAVTPAQMDTIAESDDQDALLRVAGNDAEGTPAEAQVETRGDTGDPQLPHTHGRREDTAAANEAATENQTDSSSGEARDAEEDRVRPGDRKHGRE